MALTGAAAWAARMLATSADGAHGSPACSSLSASAVRISVFAVLTTPVPVLAAALSSSTRAPRPTASSRTTWIADPHAHEHAMQSSVEHRTEVRAIRLDGGFRHEVRGVLIDTDVAHAFDCDGQPTG